VDGQHTPRGEPPISANAKTWFLESAFKGSVLLITSEDRDFWNATKYKPQAMDAITEQGPWDTVALGEVLQKVEKPLEYLKLVLQKTKRVVLTVPNEFSWNDQNQPLKNTAHKTFFDTEALAELLESAGLSYVIKPIDYSGWAWFGVEASA
jgi:hypothetical protein